MLYDYALFLATTFFGEDLAAEVVVAEKGSPVRHIVGSVPHALRTSGLGRRVRVRHRNARHKPVPTMFEEGLRIKE